MNIDHYLVETQYEQVWRDDEGRLHRDDDLPALVALSGARLWFVHGRPVRHDPEDPTAIGRKGVRFWETPGRGLRREHGPAVVYPDGRTEWHADNQLHRDGDKPAVITGRGSKHWYLHGQRHRDGGPAVIYAAVPGAHDEDLTEYWHWGTRV